MSNVGDEIAKLESPISVKRLIHKGLRAEAAGAEQLLADLEASSTLQAFKLAFNSWIMALIFYLDQETICIADPLISMPSPGQEDGPEDPVTVIREALLAQEEELHLNLMQAVEDVMSVLNEDIGRTSLITRTKQHLFSSVVSLRIVQEDYLDVQEAFIMPLTLQRLDPRQQLAAARGLLIDEMADDPGWVVQWMCNHLTINERTLLMDLEESFSQLPG